jgi:hypothetical protein
VNTNGNGTFGTANPAYTRRGLASKVGMPIVAPFFADVDVRAPGSDLVRYGSGAVDGHKAFGVDWLNFSYFYQHTGKLNSLPWVLGGIGIRLTLDDLTARTWARISRKRTGSEQRRAPPCDEP